MDKFKEGELKEGQSVGVVILTYNRLNLLKIALCKVRKQSHKNIKILVVDNKSTDGTQDFLEKEENIDTLYLSENDGPAGGFHEGVKYLAEKTKVDYLWLMDDDFFPSEFCLEILLNATDQKTVVFPHVREKDFAFRKQPGWWGVLIPIEVVRKVGYPNKDLFF